jgi:hypothetical protein
LFKQKNQSLLPRPIENQTSKICKPIYINNFFEPDEVLGKTLIYFKVKADFSVIEKMLKTVQSRTETQIENFLPARIKKIFGYVFMIPIYNVEMNSHWVSARCIRRERSKKEKNN